MKTETGSPRASWELTGVYWKRVLHPTSDLDEVYVRELLGILRSVRALERRGDSVGFD